MTRNVPRGGCVFATSVFRRIVSIGLCCAVLAGCSSVPDAVNPVEWYRGTRDWITGADKPAEQPPATKKAQNGSQSFPKLETVPDRPTPMPASERKGLARSLAADRASARYSDEVIRRQVEANDAAAAAGRAVAPAAGTQPPDGAPASQQASRESSSPKPVPPQQASRELPPMPASPLPSEPPPSMSSEIPPLSPPPMPEPPPAPARGVTTLPSPSGVPPTPSMPRVPSGQPIPPLAGIQPPSSPRTGARMPQWPLVFGPVPDDIVIDGAPPATAHQPPQRAARPRPPSAAQAPLIRADRPVSGFPAGTAAGQLAAANANKADLIASIGFASGSAKVSTAGRSELRRVARMIRSRKLRVRVVGHASSRTKNLDPMRHQMANFQVSLDRANAVAHELRQLGVSPSSITVDAVSDTQPAFYEVMPAGEAANRRVEILIEH